MGRRVLVVDDDPDVLRLVRRMLQRQGYTVTTAGDGVEALTQIARDPPDLLLTDLMMPRLDGFALVRQLQQRSVTFPIMIFSATYDVALPGIPFLRKPFHLTELVDAVASAIDPGPLEPPPTPFDLNNEAPRRDVRDDETDDESLPE